ncbi:MAG: hypothetical protein II864_05200 [Prevotella sp.]|nr:hypothetical protein [Prevotella sp.]
MKYNKQIIQILSDVGEQGIGVKLLAKHVYNLSCTLFVQPDLHEIHQYVQGYLLRNSKTPQSLIERTGRRGYYRLNTRNNAEARLMMNEFRKRNKAGADEQTDDTLQVDLSLSLFD